jgi:hypothetical protein
MVPPSTIEHHRKLISNLTIDGAMGAVEDIHSGLRRNEPRVNLLRSLRSRDFGEEESALIIDIAMTRNKAAGKFREAHKMFFTSEGLRWATPEIAADHCARRMKGNPIADITCGQGGQLLSFSRTSSRVLAMDIDPLNCFICEMNRRSMDIDNVEIVNIDCLSESAINMVGNDNYVFTDPARPPGSSERTFDEIIPDPRKIHDAYANVVEGICFEIPPYMSLEKVDFDAEAEYVSIEGRVNRLNLYTGKLKRYSRSAVILPEDHVIGGEPSMNDIPDSIFAGGCNYLNEVDPAVVKAGLLKRLMIENGWEADVLAMDHRRTMITSDEPLKSGFIKSTYKVLGRSIREEDVVRNLIDVGAGSVTLRYPVEPNEYWNIRNGFEEKLSGSRKVQLFKNEGYIITERIDV